MLANLDIFADMNNWGQREKANIRQLIVENYIPLNNNIETPHSSTPTTTTQDTQYLDYIKYYQSLSIINNKLYDSIYTEFMPLFKIIYV